MGTINTEGTEDEGESTESPKNLPSFSPPYLCALCVDRALAHAGAMPIPYGWPVTRRVGGMA